MLIESREFTSLLFSVKKNLLIVDHNGGKVGSQLRIIDSLLLLIRQMEVKGEVDMEKIKYLLMDEVGDIESARKTLKTEEFIRELIEVAKMIPEGKRVPVNTESMSPNTFYNKVWMLRRAHKIPEGLVPMRHKGKVYLAKLEIEK